ncbi:MAG: hypothetical protein WC554_06135 [Clostridia bacterium]|jgi:hypothetical protein
MSQWENINEEDKERIHEFQNLKATANKAVKKPLASNTPFKIETQTIIEKQVTAFFGDRQHVTIIRNGQVTRLPDSAWGAETINCSPDEWLEYCKAIHEAMTEGRILNKMG